MINALNNEVNETVITHFKAFKGHRKRLRSKYKYSLRLKWFCFQFMYISRNETQIRRKFEKIMEYQSKVGQSDEKTQR